jgi:sulfite reductase (ferredoxin)
MKVDGRLVDAYYFCLGGALGLHQATARPVGYRCLATEVPESIERLLRLYLTARQAGENLRQFFVRHSDTELREFLAGKPLDAVTRDLPPVGARGATAQAAGGDGD